MPCIVGFAPWWGEQVVVVVVALTCRVMSWLALVMAEGKVRLLFLPLSRMRTIGFLLLLRKL